ncbi:aminoglycoside phosphotransferase family protein [Paenisporosarcina quisquiliarum]|uniref:Aminoglycoside phosphotransferase family protein n=1 Tax=Paenisporosarcina quisquiliarum TaxID=365346 RepID=A0A9X3LHV7_9BACL|nr:aminoglycoside phosphotransferase family protein [Paenisporosarcina quisquiliarum]MCZ8538310.1 aminoglycoside phosphotransferase family protein [Paenisporosarcina quisquiliarum]
MVNKSLVFRFPKYEKGIEQLNRETAILEAIHNRLKLPTPYPRYQSFEPREVGMVFTGYHLIEGTHLWKQDFLKIENEETVSQLAAQLVSFLVELHATPLESISGLGQKQVKTPQEEIGELFKNIQTKLYPFMRKDAQDQVSHRFESFLNDDLQVIPTLIHGDFGCSNILWNPQENRISGIIDFGGAGIGDPAYDLAGILSSYGEDFFNRCIALYPNGKEIAQRVHFYRSTFALQEALHGLDNNDAEAFENGIQAYR